MSTRKRIIVMIYARTKQSISECTVFLSFLFIYIIYLFIYLFIYKALTILW